MRFIPVKGSSNSISKPKKRIRITANFTKKHSKTGKKLPVKTLHAIESVKNIADGVTRLKKLLYANSYKSEYCVIIQILRSKLVTVNELHVTPRGWFISIDHKYYEVAIKCQFRINKNPEFIIYFDKQLIDSLH